jgi:hypothetical protein
LLIQYKKIMIIIAHKGKLLFFFFVVVCLFVFVLCSGMWYHLTWSLVPNISRCCPKMLGINHSMTWCHTETWSMLLHEPKNLNVLCRIIPSNCRYGCWVLHRANYSATLTELCYTSLETCISVHHYINSASWRRCLPVCYHYILPLSEQVWNVPVPWFMTSTFTPFTSHNSYPSPLRWCTDISELYSVLNMKLLVDFS